MKSESYDQAADPWWHYRDIGQIMRLAKEIGVQECHVEQDHSPAPLESIAKSLQYLTGNAS